MKTSFRDMREVEDAFPHFFNKSAMRFFKSRIETGLHFGRYFVTSEQFVSSQGIREPRAYTVREAMPTTINTIGGFQAFGSVREALKAAELAALETMPEGYPA